MPELKTVAQVDEIFSRLSRALGEETVTLARAHGRVLRQAIRADRDLPPFDRVMMDGYAIRAEDLDKGTRFHLQGTAYAGMPQQVLGPERHAALEVMTGSPLPNGADTVIPVEDTEETGEGFRIREGSRIERGHFIHRRGSDYAKGAELVREGRLLRSVEAGIAASCGYHQVTVARQPAITVFGTGDELVPVESTPAPHQIRRSNATAIQAALASSGFPLVTVDHLSDEIDKESVRLESALREADVVIISGAVSKGKLDWIPGTLDQLGTGHFHGVRQRPGRPMGLWTTETCTVFALPGNPVSTLVGTHRYVIPFLRARQGLVEPPETVALEEAFAFDRALTLFLPVKRTRAGTVLPRPVNNSGDYARLAETDGFIELPYNENHWTPGTPAPFYPWR